MNRVRALVVEDMPIILALHERFLNDLGCLVDTAEAGYQALEQLCKNAYDIVFMDMGLPDISGDEVTRRYRAQELTSRRVPILALTAYGTVEHQEKFLSAGVDEILVKPVTKEQLSIIIKKYCL